MTNINNSTIHCSANCVNWEKTREPIRQIIHFYIGFIYFSDLRGLQFSLRSIAGQLLWRRRRPRHRSEDFLQISRQTVPLGPSALEVIRYNLAGLEEAELSRLFLENLKVILLLDESERPVVIG